MNIANKIRSIQVTETELIVWLLVESKEGTLEEISRNLQISRQTLSAKYERANKKINRLKEAGLLSL